MSKIRIHQGSRDLYVNVISVNSRYVDFIIHNDLSIDMKVPVGMSWEMIERYVRLNETMIFEEYEKKKVRNHQMLPITLDLEEGRIVYRGGLYLPFLGKTDVLLRIKYLSDFNEEETLRHPYTRALWRAMPKHGFQYINGVQPYVKDNLQGCPFAPRCDRKSQECQGEIPWKASGSGYVRCIL